MTIAQEPLTPDQFGRAVVRFLGAARPAWRPRAGEPGVVGVTFGRQAEVRVALAPHYAVYRTGHPFADCAANILRSLAEVEQAGDLEGDWGAARPRLRLKLVGAQHLATMAEAARVADESVPPEDRHLVAQPWRSGLTLACVLRLDTTAHYVTTGHLRSWRQTTGTVWPLARTQTVAALRNAPALAVTKRGWRLAVWDGLAAATRLALPELWSERESRLVAVPTEDQILAASTTPRRFGRPPVGTLATLRDAMEEGQGGAWPLVSAGYFRWVAGGDPEYVALAEDDERWVDDERTTIDGGRGGPGGPPV